MKHRQLRYLLLSVLVLTALLFSPVLWSRAVELYYQRQGSLALKDAEALQAWLLQYPEFQNIQTGAGYLYATRYWFPYSLQIPIRYDFEVIIDVQGTVLTQEALQRLKDLLAGQHTRYRIANVVEMAQESKSSENGADPKL